MKVWLKTSHRTKTLKTDILATFEQIHHSLLHDLKDERKSGELKATISNLANMYWSS